MARTTPRSPAAAPCPVCAHPLAQPERGRKRTYCSHPCRQVAYRRRRDGERKRRLITLIEADAREWLPTLPSESVDLILTDPPYWFDRGGTYFRNWFEMLRDEEWPVILRELHRILRPDRHAYIFCDPRTLPIFNAAANEAGFRVRRPLVWDKDWMGLGSAAWRPQYEFIGWYEKGSRPGNSNRLADVQRARRPHRAYPTQKPVALLSTLIAQTTLPGERVLDPFCGSGAVGLAARSLLREAVIADIDGATAARQLRLSRKRPSESR